MKQVSVFSFLILLILNSVSFADEIKSADKKDIPYLMNAIKKRIAPFKWDASIFTNEGWEQRGESVNGLPLISWSCGKIGSENSSIILSNVHGDEVTPVYFGFRLVEWLKANPQLCENKHIVIAPMVNPDGFLRYTSGTRTNYNKVDLNRNFDTPDWPKFALQLWKSKFKSEQRYFPGFKPASEPEVVFQKKLIEEHKPNKILSIHAPLNILDYDGPGTAEAKEFSKSYIDSCESLKSEVSKATSTLKFYAYGNFPGSLGNYAGKQMGIPTITTELPSTKADQAPYYFGLLEKGVRTFVGYEIKGRSFKAIAGK